MKEKNVWLNITNIKYKDKDTIPMNPKTMKLAIKLWNNIITPEDLPPIKVHIDNNGNYFIKDGRHRYIAMRLCGYKTIKSNISKLNYLC